MSRGAAKVRNRRGYRGVAGATAGPPGLPRWQVGDGHRAMALAVAPACSKASTGSRQILSAVADQQIVAAACSSASTGSGAHEAPGRR